MNSEAAYKFSFQVQAELVEVENLSPVWDTKLWGYLVWLIDQGQCHMPLPKIDKTRLCKQTCTQKSVVLKRRGQLLSMAKLLLVLNREVRDKQGPDKRGHSILELRVF